MSKRLIAVTPDSKFIQTRWRDWWATLKQADTGDYPFPLQYDHRIFRFPNEYNATLQEVNHENVK